MCDKETKKILGDMEARLRREIEDVRTGIIEYVDDSIMKSHNEAMQLVHKTAPETKGKIEKIDKWIENHEAVTDKIILALFGNKELKIDGIVETNAEMKKLLTRVYTLVWAMSILLAGVQIFVNFFK